MCSVSVKEGVVLMWKFLYGMDSQGHRNDSILLTTSVKVSFCKSFAALTASDVGFASDLSSPCNCLRWSYFCSLDPTVMVEILVNNPFIVSVSIPESIEPGTPFDFSHR